MQKNPISFAMCADFAYFSSEIQQNESVHEKIHAGDCEKTETISTRIAPNSG